MKNYVPKRPNPNKRRPFENTDVYLVKSEKQIEKYPELKKYLKDDDGPDEY